MLQYLENGNRKRYGQSKTISG